MGEITGAPTQITDLVGRFPLLDSTDLPNKTALADFHFRIYDNTPLREAIRANWTSNLDKNEASVEQRASFSVTGTLSTDWTGYMFAIQHRVNLDKITAQINSVEATKRPAVVGFCLGDSKSGGICGEVSLDDQTPQKLRFMAGRFDQSADPLKKEPTATYSESISVASFAANSSPLVEQDGSWRPNIDINDFIQEGTYGVYSGSTDQKVEKNQVKIAGQNTNLHFLGFNSPAWTIITDQNAAGTHAENCSFYIWGWLPNSDPTVTGSGNTQVLQRFEDN